MTSVDWLPNVRLMFDEVYPWQQIRLCRPGFGRSDRSKLAQFHKVGAVPINTLMRTRLGERQSSADRRQAGPLDRNASPSQTNANTSRTRSGPK
jgi:hypothetical protein